MEYVLGFVFDTDGRFLLLRKDRPEWMAGKWNGVGGKIEEDEAPQTAMSRECSEETGLHIAPEHWDRFAVITDKSCIIHCYRVKLTPEDLSKASTMETEEVYIASDTGATAKMLSEDGHMPNLLWLIAMAMTKPADTRPYGIYH